MSKTDEATPSPHAVDRTDGGEWFAKQVDPDAAEHVIEDELAGFDESMEEIADQLIERAGKGPTIKIEPRDDFDALGALAESMDRERDLVADIELLRRRLDAALALADRRKQQLESPSLWERVRRWCGVGRSATGVATFPLITVKGRELLEPDAAEDLRGALSGFEAPKFWLPHGVEVTFYDRQGNMHVLQEGRGMIQHKLPPNLEER